MKFVWGVVALAALTMSAQAQPTTTTAPTTPPAATTPAAPVPPSTCPAFTPTPAPPDGARATQRQIDAAVAAFEAWRVNEQAVMDCRRAEVGTLDAQARARADEYRAAAADNTARGAAFQAQLDAFNARTNRRR